VPVALYGCKTWSLTLSEERRMWVIETECWGEYLHLRGTRRHGSGENYVMKSLMIFFSSPDIFRANKSRRIRWVGHVARLSEMRCVYKGFGGETWQREPLGRTRRRWEDNIKMDLQEVGCESMDWIYPAQDRDKWRALVNGVMNLWDP